MQTLIKSELLFQVHLNSITIIWNKSQVSWRLCLSIHMLVLGLVFFCLFVSFPPPLESSSVSLLPCTPSPLSRAPVGSSRQSPAEWNAISACHGPASLLPSHGMWRRWEKTGGRWNRGHSQPWSLERALLAISVSKSPASLQLCGFYIFLVEEGVSKLSLTASEFMEWE